MEDEETMLSRHRAERKNLQNQITGMKKQATKSKRKEVNARCEELEYQLRLRHEQELKEVTQGTETENENQDVTPEKLLEQLTLGHTSNGDGAAAAEKQEVQISQQPGPSTPQPKKKRNRQREKIAERNAEIARIKEAAAQEAAEMPDYRKMEQDALDEICRLNKLHQHDIQPDGHCLFASILDQIRTRHNDECVYDIPATYVETTAPQDPKDFNVYALRSLACCYIREHPDDFVPYLFDETTLTVKDISDYTKSMQETAEWGGEVEILALAKVLKCCVSVLMSGRATHKVNEQESANPQLNLVYYKHSYALGEHYNSLRDE
ncbi:LAFA_0F07646g1_1 [Lachancea sp. 'fantastica']|nr:LAFA_0F07646g1_1 [Lachancea sp. 'fantastica']